MSASLEGLRRQILDGVSLLLWLPLFLQFCYLPLPTFAFDTRNLSAMTDAKAGSYQPDDGNDAGRKLFERTCTFYEQIGGFKADVIIERVMNNASSRVHTVHKMHFQKLKSGYFFLEMKQPKRHSQVLLSNGVAQMYSSQWNMRTTQKCTDFVDLLTNSDFNLLTDGRVLDCCIQALSLYPDRLGKGVETFTIEKDCRYGGSNCSILKMHRPIGDTRFWIEDGNEPWIRRIELMRNFRNSVGNLTSMFSRYNHISSCARSERAQLTFKNDCKTVSQLVAQSGASNSLINTKAPAFKVRTTAGEHIDSSKLAGKVVVLDFWATWCGPCKRELPEVSALADKFGSRGVVFIAIDKMEESNVVKSFVDSNKYNLQFCIDTDGKIGDAYHVDGIPHTVVIGKDELVKACHIGNSPTLKSEIESEIQALLVP